MATPSGGPGSQRPRMSFAQVLKASFEDSGTAQQEKKKSAFGFEVKEQEQPLLSLLPRSSRPPELPVSGPCLLFSSLSGIEPVSSSYFLHPTADVPPSHPDESRLLSLGGLSLRPEEGDTLSGPTATSDEGLTTTQRPTDTKTGGVPYQPPASPEPRKKPAAAPVPSVVKDKGRGKEVTTKPVSRGAQAPDILFLAGLEHRYLKNQFSALDKLLSASVPKNLMDKLCPIIKQAYEKFASNRGNIDFILELLAFHLTIAYKMLGYQHLNEAGSHFILVCGCLHKQRLNRWGVSSVLCLELSKFVAANNSISMKGMGVSAKRSDSLSSQQQCQLDLLKKRATPAYALCHALRCENAVNSHFLQEPSSAHHPSMESRLAIKHFTQLQKDLDYIRANIGKFDLEEDQALYQQAIEIAERYKASITKFKKLQS